MFRNRPFKTGVGALSYRFILRMTTSDMKLYLALDKNFQKKSVSAETD